MPTRINRTWVRRTRDTLKARPCPACGQVGDESSGDGDCPPGLTADDVSILDKITVGDPCATCGRCGPVDLSALSLAELLRLESVLSCPGGLN